MGPKEATVRTQFARREFLGAGTALFGVTAAGPLLAQQAPATAMERVRGPLVWLDMDQAELDAAYDQIKYAPNLPQVTKRYATNSEAARSRLGPPRRFAYGPNTSFKEETNMGELRYPNESSEYRDARESLLKDEQELVDKVKSVAERRRNLPPGGQLKEDYVFQWANDGKVGKSVKFSELFADKSTLLLYSFMYGPSWDNPCPSCTSLVDGFDRTWYQVTQNAAFVAIAKAPADRINAWATKRGWSQIALVSGSDSTYQADYKCQGDSDDMQWPVMHVFRKRDGKIFHFWGTEVSANHVDTVWPYWNLMDFTPEGRPDIPTPPQNFRSEFLEKNYLNKE